MSALGKQILAGLADARDFARGRTAGQRIHRVAVPAQVDVRRIRTRLQMTQSSRRPLASACPRCATGNKGNAYRKDPLACC